MRSPFASLFLLLAAWSLITSSALASGAAPSVPQNLQGDIDGTRVVLSWEAASDDGGVQGYNVYRDDRYLSTVFDTRYSGEVAADRLYTFRIVAFDAAPRSFSSATPALSLPASLLPSDLTIPPSVPTTLTGNIDGSDVVLNWTASTDDEAVRGYNVYRDERYLSTVFEPRYAGKVAIGARHSWYVVAFDIRDNFSARSARITLPDEGPVDTSVPPAPPTGLSGEVTAGAEADTVTLAWSEALDDRGIAGYNVHVNGRYRATRFQTRYTTTTASGSSNDFSVVAFDIDGNFSTTSTVLTLPVGPGSTDPGVPPSVPVALEGSTRTADGAAEVTLGWAASDGPAGVAGYNVYRDGRYLTTVFATGYTDRVAAGEPFSYSIVAFDRFQNFSARSAPLNLLGDANRAPFFSDLGDRTLNVGQPFELVLRPVDLDGGAAGILTGPLPAGMSNVDNGDGSRSLLWTPTTADIGQTLLTLTAFDLTDTDLRTEQGITLTVVGDGEPATVAPFGITLPTQAIELREGDPDGASVAITVTREPGFDGVLQLAVEDVDGDGDAAGAALSADTLGADETRARLTLLQPIGILPIQPAQRRYRVSASDGTRTVSAAITVAVTPSARDDVYLLLGQSNMVGFSEAGAKRAGAGDPDEPLPRIRQLNVTANEASRFDTPGAYTAAASNVVAPALISAEDPLHEPLGPGASVKSGTRIGPGLAFAKQALPLTTRNIVLVPAAWSGSGFCDTQDPAAHWNADDTSDDRLGNTLMFDRALTRVNEALSRSAGILRGILWLQGEADSRSACAPLYQDNLDSLVAALRTRIAVDARGADARGANAPVPFVVGTLSRGADEQSDVGNLSASEAIVDTVLKGIAGRLPYADVSLHDDLVPANGYPCGTNGCIHFGADALREIGVRFHDALLRASRNVP